MELKGETRDNKLIWVLSPGVKVKLEQKRGPNMEPWGAPGAGGQKDEEGPVKETEMEESVKQDEN